MGNDIGYYLLSAKHFTSIILLHPQRKYFIHEEKWLREVEEQLFKVTHLINDRTETSMQACWFRDCAPNLSKEKQNVVQTTF